MIRVVLPQPLRTLAEVQGEVLLDLAPPVTVCSVLEALERRYPALRGTMRNHDTGERRPMVRFFACEADWSHEPMDAPLPEPVAQGKQPLVIVGAIAGG